MLIEITWRGIRRHVCEYSAIDMDNNWMEGFTACDRAWFRSRSKASKLGHARRKRDRGLQRDKDINTLIKGE